ncbi:uncharacterized protein IUM83_11928 [Phytophthora cinnamomi]|uniref:uncharacterized protein n=1 Tax=Phytophthora cinnamomi TaxID=4785 RepID=UPI00355A3A37|nr:hypothetical protein IUM83_11928 [Phytophthora cinnamomi]
MPSFRVDADGDVEMAAPPPVFEIIKAPELKSWDQESLVEWLRKRRRYREEIVERCRISQEPVDAVLRSVRASLSPKLLNYLAHYVFRQPRDAITHQEILDKIQERVSEVMNGHIPDMYDFFKTHLKMDMDEKDVQARVVKYFVDFDQLIEEHGFTSMLAADGQDRSDYRDRMKNRCKRIVENLAPAVLKTEIKRLVLLQHREAKTDDIALHQLVLARAKVQQRYHMLTQEAKTERKPPSKGDQGKRTSRPDASRVSNRPQGTPRAPTAGPKPGNSSGAASRPPPRDGCYFCKGPHVVRLRPTATEEQKMLCYQRMKDTEVAKVKAARASRLPGNRQVVINGLVELPYRPDSGSDVNVIPASALRDLEACGAPVAVTNMLMPVYLERVGGDLLACRTSCDVDVMMGTAAGPVNVANVRCIIVDDDEEEFLLGNPTLVALSIDVGRQMEQLAMSSSGVYSEENDSLPDDPETGQDDEAEVQELLDQLVANAGDNGFSPEHMSTLRRVVSDYRDVRSIRVGAGEPARVEPYRLQLKEGSQPVRCKPRRYSPLASTYTSNYVKQLVASGYIYPNNASRWASAVVPVPKADGEEFRITYDYRLINIMTVPIAASVPNLAVVSQRVKGAKALGKSPVLSVAYTIYRAGLFAMVVLDMLLSYTTVMCVYETVAREREA